MQELEELARKGSIDSLRIFYLIGKVIGEEKISVTDQELLSRAMQKVYQTMNLNALKDKKEMERMKQASKNELMIEANHRVQPIVADRTLLSVEIDVAGDEFSISVGMTIETIYHDRIKLFL